jgi:hypothetical protein
VKSIYNNYDRCVFELDTKKFKINPLFATTSKLIDLRSLIDNLAEPHKNQFSIINILNYLKINNISFHSTYFYYIFPFYIFFYISNLLKICNNLDNN